MDAHQFDRLTKTLARGTSRRRVLRGVGGGVAGAALAGWGRRQAGATPRGKSGCAAFCAAVFGDTHAAGQCTSAAAQGSGLCFSACGPAGTGGGTLCGDQSRYPTTTCCSSGQRCGTDGICQTCAANGGTCGADSDCCSTICQGETCVATVAGTCMAGQDSCGGTQSLCGNGQCDCLQTAAGATICGQTAGCVESGPCPDGTVAAVGGECCSPNWTLCVPPCPPRSECFVAGTRVAMADGTSKPIEWVAPGDLVLGRGGVNRVLANDRHPLGPRPLYALNGGAPFVTAGHPFLTEAGWKAIDPAETAREAPGLAVGRLAVGDRLLAVVGVAMPAPVGGGRGDGAPEARVAAVPLAGLDAHAADPGTPIFNLRVDGDHTYVADDWLVHNKM